MSSSLSQPGFFDLSERFEALSKGGDPLEKLNTVVDWQIFMPLIRRAFAKQRKSTAGRKPFNRLMMFKVLVLQSLYNLSDHQTEFQIRDRLSFMRFLGLDFEDRTPDEKTIWAYREELIQRKVIKKLFDRFNQYLDQQGLSAACGTIVDASIIEAPRQRNSKDENQQIKEGKVPKQFEENPHVLRQKDVEARWTKKRMQSYYGYKDHISIDVKHKLIRCYEVSAANVGDIHFLEALLDERNESKHVYGDQAYCSDASLARLEVLGYHSRLNRRCCYEDQMAWSAVVRENRRRSKIRKRVEHVFGLMHTSLGGKYVRTVGLVRAKAKIGLMNLAHNLCRYEQLCRLGVS